MSAETGTAVPEGAAASAAAIERHYEQVLADVYAWMLGGLEAGLERNRAFFREHGIAPAGNGLAVDLGAGCGFQAIPLAELGFSVTAVDLSAKLLAELDAARGDLEIVTIHDDLMSFRTHVRGPLELAVCMQDTILHLGSLGEVRRLIRDVFEALGPGGRFVLTFRELVTELTGTDRFLPLRSDDDTILTCFLEYGPDTVTVHDLVYNRTDDGWRLYKSAYEKLRASTDAIVAELEAAGFSCVAARDERGLVTVLADKSR